MAPVNDLEHSGGQASVRDHRAPPPGVLSKNAQAMVIGGISVVVVVVIGLFGGRGTEPTQPTPGPVQQGAVSEEEELSRRLAEQLRQQEQSMRAMPRPVPPPHEGPSSLDLSAPPSSELPDDIAQRMRELEFTSLFASNIALTYREEQEYTALGGRRTPGNVAALESVPYLTPAERSLVYPSALVPPPGFATQNAQATPGQGTPGANTALPANNSQQVNSTDSDAPPPSDGAPSSPATSNPVSSNGRYTVYEGTIIETSLINRLDSSFAGPVLTMVTNPVYSHDRQELLIPPGTKCIGETTPVEHLGQTRMAVSFHRLILPNGASINLDRFQGLNQLGDTGLKDKVNRHYFQIFGTSIALGFLGAIAQSQFVEPFDSAGPQFARSAAQILDRFLNIPPTITVREGHRIKIFITQDLQLPPYRPGSRTEF